MGFDKAGALGDSLAVAIDLVHVGELGAGFDEQIVVDLETQRAHDMEIELGEQVVDGVNRAGGGVLDGQQRQTRRSRRATARMTPSKVSKNAMSGTSKSLHAAIWL